MKPFVHVGFILLCFLSVPGISSAEDTALYSGKCRNVTFGLDGLLKLFIIDKGTEIEGYMSISGWLIGSGPLKGTRDGTKFRFRTEDPLWGLVIDWQGSLDGNKLSGEYFSKPSPTLGTPKQVGEWEATLVDKQKDGIPESEASFKQLFLLKLEGDLNAPVRQKDGTSATGAQSLFEAIHPVGNGVSVNVEDVEIDWKQGTAKKSVDDIHKFMVTYVLYWHGVVTPSGWTRLRLAYNRELDAVTAHDIVQSTGTTKKEVEDLAFGIGVLLGKAAMDSLLNSK